MNLTQIQKMVPKMNVEFSIIKVKNSGPRS